MSVVFVFRLGGMVVFGFLGWTLSASLWGRSLTEALGVQDPAFEQVPWVASMVLAGMALGLIVTPYITLRPFRWVRRQIEQLPANVLFAAIIGLVIGLFASALLAFPVSMLPGIWGKVLPVATSLFTSYLGVSIMVLRERDLLQMMGSYLPGGGPSQRARSGGSDRILVDTSAIIDGRIADISQTGFLRGTMVIPRFILDELRHIADSSDVLRRNRGRRGLEMLNRLQKESDVPIEIMDVDVEGMYEVDAKLIHLARDLHCPIATNDFNLNRVAELQGVRVLNVNELANAVKSVVLPGEDMQVRIIQEGKEVGQGVGFLDDGTMVVVEGGKRYINNQLDIVVTRVLQTVAGRMIFAHPKAE